MADEFQPGDLVLWWKPVGDKHLEEVVASVVQMTAGDVAINAEDPEGDCGEFLARTVPRDSLELLCRAPLAGDDPAGEAGKLFDEGEGFADEERDMVALACFRMAWGRPQAARDGATAAGGGG